MSSNGKRKRGNPRRASKQDPWLTVFAAHVVLGVSRQTVYQMVVRKELRSKTIAGRLVISRADVRKAVA